MLKVLSESRTFIALYPNLVHNFDQNISALDELKLNCG